MERMFGRILYRTTFGTQRWGGPFTNAFDLKLKNPANTNVLVWGDRLFALWEVRALLGGTCAVGGTCQICGYVPL